MPFYESVGMEGILVEKNEYPYTAKERELKTKTPNVKLFKCPYGSHRFVLYINENAVSGIQIMMNQTRQFYVANVFTKESYRRNGHARKLFETAKEKLKTNIIYHSSNLSYLGKIFSKNVN